MALVGDRLEVRLFPLRWKSVVRFGATLLFFPIAIPILFGRSDPISQALLLAFKIVLACLAACFLLLGIGWFILQRMPLVADLSPDGASFTGQFHVWSEFVGYRRMRVRGQDAIGFVASPTFVPPSTAPKALAAHESLRSEYGVDLVVPVMGTDVTLPEVVSFVARYLPEVDGNG